MSAIIIKCIRIYQRVSKLLIVHRMSPWAFSGCRQWPTCSDFTIHAIQQEGYGRGLAKGILRIARCNPFIAAHY